MRKVLIFWMLATTAVPAMAQDGTEERRYRTERPERSERADRPERAERPERIARPQRGEERGFNRSPEGNSDRSPERPQTRVANGPGDDPATSARWGRGDRSREPDNRIGDLPGNRRQRALGREWIEEERRVRNQAETEQQEVRRQRWARDRRDARPYDGEWNEHLRERAGRTNIPREGSQPPLRVARDDRNSPRNHWRSDWRTDHRYDWRRHRERNRWLFSLGNYYDPFGWNYRRFSVGRRLWPDFYSARYWLDDPWQYRLPPAYPGTRWIRYHGDAILVDIWSGEVIDVLHNVFW